MNANVNVNLSEDGTRTQPKLDVLFLAEDYRPGWMGHGAGWLAGGWTAILALKWLWEALGAWGILLWPVVWAVGFILVAQMTFVVGSLLSIAIRLPKHLHCVVVGLLLLVLWSWEAGRLMDSESVLERGLAWGWWVCLGGALLAEAVVKIWRKGKSEK